MNTNTERTAHLYAELAKLEEAIAQGILAYDRRNAVIVELFEAGERQADITRHLNKVRTSWHVPTLTPDAVAATIKRVKDKSRGEAVQA